MATSSWEKLTEILPEDQREELAEVLLEALAAATWAEVKIETREHHLHAAGVAKTHLFHHPKRKITCNV